jgi:hypothetical protein
LIDQLHTPDCRRRPDNEGAFVSEKLRAEAAGSGEPSIQRQSII